MFRVILLGIMLYFATNIDEFFLGLLFVVQPETKKSDVWIGKFIALAVVLGLSIIFVLVIQSFDIPTELIGILGFLPLYIGIKSLLDKDEEDELEEAKEKIEKMKDKKQWLIIAIVHIASGGDNIGVYVSSLSYLTIGELIIILVVFLSLTALWVLSPYWIVKNENLKEKLQEWGEKIFPWIMIILAVSIFWETGFFGYLWNLIG